MEIKNLGLSFNFQKRACQIFLGVEKFTLEVKENREGIRTTRQASLSKISKVFTQILIRTRFGCWDNAKDAIQTMKYFRE